MTVNKISRNPSFTDGGTGASNQTVEVAEDVVELDEDNTSEEGTDVEADETSEAEIETDGTETEETADDAEVTEGDEADDAASAETVQTVEPAEEPVTIGDKQYTKQQLDELLNKGLKVKEWETKMPGFDVDKLMPDYTKKSQLLSKYEKQASTPKPSKISKDELVKMGIDDDQIRNIELVAKHLGFVHQNDVVQNTVESQKEAFIQEHQQYYGIDVPGGDQKWQALVEEFNTFNWQSMPQRVGEFLERAHERVSKAWVEQARGTEVKNNITVKKAQADAIALGGTNSKTTQKPAPQAQAGNAALRAKYQRLGWSEEDINEILT